MRQATLNKTLRRTVVRPPRMRVVTYVNLTAGIDIVAAGPSLVCPGESASHLLHGRSVALDI